MKIITSIIFLFSCIVFAQEKQLLENITIDDNTVLIGMYPQYDENKTYSSLNFYIKDKAVIESLVPRMTLNKKGPNVVEKNDFVLVVLQGNEQVGHWSISPLYGTIRVAGEPYKFDIGLLKELAAQYPFEYSFYNKEFNNKEEYDKYVNSLKGREKNFLFAYAPDFKYEGSFTISFPKSDKYPHPKAIHNHLDPKAEAIAGKDNYSISYVVDEYNRNNPNQMTMTIRGSKELHDKLEVDKLPKKNWAYNKPSAMFFIKK